MIAKGSTNTTIDRGTCTISFEREFSASREQLFDAWTKPEHIRQWWDPTGVPLSDCSVDLRPGGTFLFTNRDSAHSPPFSGTYRVVNPPAELVFEALGAVGTVVFEARSAITHMTVSIRCASPEHLEEFIRLGVDTGTDRTLDNLVAYSLKQAS